jgi:hypothetical protein
VSEIPPASTASAGQTGSACPTVERTQLAQLTSHFPAPPTPDADPVVSVSMAAIGAPPGAMSICGPLDLAGSQTLVQSLPLLPEHAGKIMPNPPARQIIMAARNAMLRSVSWRDSWPALFIGLRKSAERLAVQRCGRRRAGTAILRRCPCGDHIRCNGLLGGVEENARFVCP